MNNLISLQYIENSLQIDKTPTRTQPEIIPILAETSPQNKTPHHNAFNLIPAFPQFHRGSVRKSILIQKSPKNDAPFGLFPIEHSNSNPKEVLKKASFARIGMPTIHVVPSGEKNTPNRAKELSAMKSIGKSYSFKDLVTVESKVLSGDGDTPKNVKTLDLGSAEASKVAILMKKLRSGRINIQHLSDNDLMHLAVEILKKLPDNRTPIEIAVLVKCVAFVEFFKKHDYKTTENCVKAMHLVSLKAGEAVFNIGDIGTTFWVIVKGSVGVWHYVDQVIGETDKGESIVEKVFKEARILHPGSGFGETGLVDKKPRASSVLCKEDCEFAVLEQTPFKEIIREAMEKKLFEEVNFLAALPLFKTWEFEAVKQLFSFAPIVTYKRGNVIYDEGDQPDKMYVVKKGTFKVLKEVEIEESHRNHYNEEMNKFRRSQVNRKTIQLGILGEKELFGEDELLDPAAGRKYKIVCESLQGEVYEISSKEFESMIMENEHTANWLQKHMKAKKKYYEERFKTTRETTEQHRHLLFFSKSPVHAGSYGRNQHRTNKSSANNSKIQQNDEEGASISYYPEGRFTVKQTFLGENPKYLNPAILEESIEKYKNSAAYTTQKAKGRTCSNSPSGDVNQQKEQQSPLKLGLLQLAIHELNLRKKTTSTTCSPQHHEPIKMTNKRIDGKKTNFFQDSQNEITWGNGSLENLEERRVSFKKGWPEIQSPYEIGGSNNAMSLVMHSKTKSLSKERERSQEFKNVERLKVTGIESFQGKFPIVRQNCSNDERFKLMKIGSPNSIEGSNDWYESPNISRHAGLSNSRSVKIMKELEALKKKGAPKISWEGQRRRWKEIMQEKAGKSYKRMFYSRDETFEMKSGEQTEIMKIDQQEPNSSIYGKEKNKEPAGRGYKDGSESQQRNTRNLQSVVEGLRRVVSSTSLAFSIKGEKTK